MKKLLMSAGLLTLGTTMAVASSLAIPWFVDTAPERNKVPGVADGVTGIVTIKSNRTDALTVTIEYYNQGGYFLGPLPTDPSGNTFSIAPLSSLAFRPYQADPDRTATYPAWDPRSTLDNDGAGPDGIGRPSAGGGQEGSQGVAVPDRPRTTVTPDSGGLADSKPNGSITLRWQGGAQDVQGQVAYFQTAGDLTMSYAHLLPPGI